MRETVSQRFARRVITIPATVVAFGVVAFGFPLMLMVALATDLLAPHPNPLPRRGGEGASFSSTRLAVAALCFLAVENLGLVLLGWTWVSTSAHSKTRASRTFAIQRLYTGWHLNWVSWVFSLTFVVKGAELVLPGPLLVFVRHASLVDVLIPGAFIANVHKVELRYVLKRELLFEPCLDLAGHWIPNHFVERGGKNTELELSAIAALKGGIGQNEGVIIYPEGTRFSSRMRELTIGKLEGASKVRAEKLRHLLPIRLGGAMTLLGAEPQADVLFVGHHGLEGLTRLGDIWRGSLVGRTITVQFWREKAEHVPSGDEARLAWVNERWQLVDDWLEEFE